MECEDFTPGSGRLDPRAALRSDAPSLDLNGTWRFRLSPTAGAGRGLRRARLRRLRLGPSCRCRRTGSCTGTAARPTPTSPTRSRSTRRTSPTENPTGDHRRAFDLPDGWPGPGAACCASTASTRAPRVWLNGHRARAFTTGSRLPPEFDGRAAAAARRATCSRSACTSGRPGSYLEDQDMWWLSGHLPRRDAAGPAGRRRRRLLRARRLRPRHRRRHAARRHRRRRPAQRPRAGLDVAGRRAVTTRRRRAVDRRDARGCTTAVLATAEASGSRCGSASARSRIEDGVLTRQRPARPVPGRQPARVPPRPRPRADRRDDARGRAADEAAQHQRRPHQPLPAAPRLPRPVRRARAVGHRRVRPGDARLRPGRTGGGNPSDDPRWRRRYLDRMRRMVERDKNHPSSSCGRSATSAGTGREPGRDGRLDRVSATRPGRSTTRATGPAAYVDVYCRMYAVARRGRARSAGGEERPLDDPALTRGGGRCRSSCASTRTRWATGPAGSPSTRSCSSGTRAARAASSGSGSTTASGRTADGRRVRLRRRLRRAAARRQLRHRRAAVPGPHAVARDCSSTRR